MHYLRLIAVFFWCGMTYAQPNTVFLEENMPSRSVLPQAQWIITNETLRIADIANIDDSQWASLKQVFTPTDDTALWVKFSISRSENAATDSTLLVNIAQQERVEVFMLDQYQHLHRTFSSDNADALFASHLSAIPLRFYTQETVDVYIRYLNKNHQALFISLAEPSLLEHWSSFQMSLIALYIGALGILILLYFITYVNFHDPVRYWFALLLSSHLLMFLNDKNMLSFTQLLSATYSQWMLVFSTLMILSTHKLLSHLHKNTGKWQQKRIILACSSALVLGLVLPEQYTNLVTLLLVVGYISMSLYQATFWQSLLSTSAARYLLLGWGCISLINLTSIGIGSSWLGISNVWHTVIFVLFTLGIILQVLGIELFDRVADILRRKDDERNIDNLNYFYQLFKSSAEGLYTSTFEGQIETVNAAIYQLFGYESEEQFLSEITNTEQLYANKHQRNELLQQLNATGAVIGKELKGLKRDGSEFWFSLSVQVHSHNGRQFLYGSIFDISQKIENANNLHYINEHDTLTDSLNRQTFEGLVNQWIQQLDTKKFTILYLDVDQFKLVNDMLGHEAGDELLQDIADKIQKTIGSAGKLARIAGDEFAVAIECDTTTAHRLANKLINIIGSIQFNWNENVLNPTVSIGLVEYRSYMADATKMINMADAACYMAKEQGRNQFHVYSRKDQSLLKYQDDIQWLRKINDAIDNNQFKLYHQCIESMHQDSTGAHYELLLRLQDHDGCIVGPGVFLPIAERFNLMGRIDRWVIKAYCDWYQLNASAHQNLFQCNINLTANSLIDANFKQFIIDQFERAKVPFDKICFEITESQAISNEEDTLNFILALKERGCKFALDDFGTGFSSYVNLRQLPVNYVKVDGQFVKHIVYSKIDRALVDSIYQVATSMGIACVGEFVENKAIAKQLAGMGIQYAQGYEFSVPSPLDEIVNNDNAK